MPEQPWYKDIGPGAQVAWAAVAFMVFVIFTTALSGPPASSEAQPQKHYVYGTMACYDSTDDKGNKVFICDPPLNPSRRPY